MDLVHEERLTKVEERCKSNSHRLDEVEKKQNDLSELVGTVKVLATKEEQVERDVKEIKSDMKILVAKPGNRWEAMVSEVVKLLIAAAMGYFLSKL